MNKQGMCLEKWEKKLFFHTQTKLPKLIKSFGISDVENNTEWIMFWQLQYELFAFVKKETKQIERRILNLAIAKNKTRKKNTENMR